MDLHYINNFKNIETDIQVETGDNTAIAVKGRVLTGKESINQITTKLRNYTRNQNVKYRLIKRRVFVVFEAFKHCFILHFNRHLE